jgi:hypothetical protein
MNQKNQLKSMTIIKIKKRNTKREVKIEGVIAENKYQKTQTGDIKMTKTEVEKKMSTEEEIKKVMREEDMIASKETGLEGTLIVKTEKRMMTNIMKGRDTMKKTMINTVKGTKMIG